jgi:phage terminase large subunit-like protein
MSKPKPIDKGKAAVDFMEKLPLWRDFFNVRFKARPWQREILETIYGKVDRNGRRLIKKAFISFGRKQAKTTVMALAIVKAIVYDDRRNQEIVSVAWTHKQAMVLFNVVKSIIMQVPELRKRCSILKTGEIEYLPKGNVYRALANNPDALQGMGPSLIIMDELHVWEGIKGYNLYESLKKSQGAVKEPLCIIITTAGNTPGKGICWEEYSYAKRWLAGKEENENYAAWVYEVPKDADPFDESKWHLGMPGLGDFVNLDSIQADAIEAKTSSHKLQAFKQYYLNQWVDSSFSWIDADAWSKCYEDFKAEDLIGQRCIAAFDFGPIRDMTALVLMFEGDDGKYRLVPFFWVAEETVKEREKSDDTRFSEWVEQKLIRTTKGKAVRRTTLRQQVLDILREYQCEMIAADPFGCGDMLDFWRDEGIVEYRYSQKIGNISTPAKTLEAMILNGEVLHNGNPVLTWCFNNAVAKLDSFENLRPMKATSGGRVDAVVCTVMALGCFMAIGDTSGEQFAMI